MLQVGHNKPLNASKVVDAGNYDGPMGKGRHMVEGNRFRKESESSLGIGGGREWSFVEGM